MAYATVQDMIDSFTQKEVLQLSNVGGTAGATTINEVKLGRALDWATDVANSNLKGRAPLPLDPVPPLIRDIVCDLARYRLDQLQPREDVRKRYEDAMRQLKDIRTGQLDLGLTAADEPVAVAEESGPLIDEGYERGIDRELYQYERSGGGYESWT